MARKRKRHVDASVALAILVGLRDADRPEEVLQDEDLSITLPRRLGLSEVVGRGIRRYEEDARKGRRVPEAEVSDLVALVVRRGDADDVFRDVGRALAFRDGGRPLLSRVAPGGLKIRIARREVTRRLRRLFGPGVARFEKGAFKLVGLDVPFVDADPGGEVCEIVTGLCEGIVRVVTAKPVTIRRWRSATTDGYSDRWEIRESGSDLGGAVDMVSVETAPDFEQPA